MQHNFIGLLLLGGTGGALLGGSLIQSEGPALVLLGLVSIVFLIGFVSHAKTLGKQE